MSIKEAISVLIQGCDVGQKSGAYTLNEAFIIYQAILAIKDSDLNIIQDKEESKNE